MWLIDIKNDYTLRQFPDHEIPTYAILSHRWGQDEPSFDDFKEKSYIQREGWAKVKSACDQAESEDIFYMWADTCCINKASSAELQEAINSMFRWYKLAALCYVYLCDVHLPPDSEQTAESEKSEGEQLKLKHVLEGSSWFTRGWTLQELIAPREIVFFDANWNKVGTKDTLTHIVSDITRIEPSVLLHEVELSSVSIAKRMSWASKRQTSRIEDLAYSLLGIFDVNIPMLYGEGNKAFTRLQEEIIKTSTDHSIFAWQSLDSLHTGDLLAESPANFAFDKADKIVPFGQSTSFSLTNRGLSISLLHDQIGGLLRLNRDDVWAALNCTFENDFSGVIALRLIPYYQSDNDYHVISSFEESGPRHDSPDPSWDIHSVAKFGFCSRLAFITEARLLSGLRSSINITRRPEQRDSAIVFRLKGSNTVGKITAVYPQRLWNVTDLLVKIDGRLNRLAGFIIARSPIDQWVVTFGIRRLRQMEYSFFLSASRYDGSSSIESSCQYSESISTFHRLGRQNLPSRVPSISEPGELTVCLRKTEMMGVVVCTVSVGFSHSQTIAGSLLSGLALRPGR